MDELAYITPRWLERLPIPAMQVGLGVKGLGLRV